MGSSQSTDVMFSDDNVNWDANEYFRKCFKDNRKVQFNMKCTLYNLLNGGFVQKDLNYIYDQ